MAKISSLEIVIHNRPVYYQPGDAVCGVCVINVTRSVEMMGLHISLLGRSELDSKESKSTAVSISTWLETSKKLRDSKIYVNLMYDVYDPNSNLFGDCLTGGQHKVPFRFIFPSRSVEADSVAQPGFKHIRYLLAAEICMPLTTLNYKKVVKLLVVNGLQNPMDNLVPCTRAACQEVSTPLNSGHLSLRTTLCKDGYCPAEVIGVKCIIENFTEHIITPRLEIHQRNCSTKLSDKRHFIKINECHGLPVAKETIAEWTSPLTHIPTHYRSKRDSRFMKHEYVAVVILGIPNNFTLNLYVELPVLVGEMPRRKASRDPFTPDAAMSFAPPLYAPVMQILGKRNGLLSVPLS